MLTILLFLASRKETIKITLLVLGPNFLSAVAKNEPPVRSLENRFLSEERFRLPRLLHNILIGAKKASSHEVTTLRRRTSSRHVVKKLSVG